jgi:hypothetical protein
LGLIGPAPKLVVSTLALPTNVRLFGMLLTNALAYHVTVVKGKIVLAPKIVVSNTPALQANVRLFGMLLTNALAYHVTAVKGKIVLAPKLVVSNRPWPCPLM